MILKLCFMFLAILLEGYTTQIFLDEYYFRNENKNYLPIILMMMGKTLILTYAYSLILSFILDLMFIYTYTRYYRYYDHERLTSILVLFVVYQVIDILSLLSLSHFFVKSFDEFIYSHTIFSYIYLFLPKYVSYALVKEIMIKEDLDFTKENYKRFIIGILPLILLVFIHLLSTIGFIFNSIPSFETNLMSLGIIFIALQCVALIYYIKTKHSHKDNTSNQIDRLTSYKETIDKDLSEIKTIRHDLKHDYRLIKEMIRKEDYDKALHYLDNLTEKTDKVGKHIHSEYPYLDSVINTHLDKMLGMNTDVRLTISSFTLGYLEELEFSVILSNALENAYEALQEVRNRVFKLTMYNENDQLICVLENTVKSDYQFNEYTTKEDKNNHGFGLKTIRKYIHKCHGTMRINADKTFVLSLKIPTKRH